MLVLLAGGLSNKEIAHELGTTENTVKATMSVYVFPALGVTTRLEAGLWAAGHMDLLQGAA